MEQYLSYIKYSKVLPAIVIYNFSLGHGIVYRVLCHPFPRILAPLGMFIVQTLYYQLRFAVHPSAGPKVCNGMTDSHGGFVLFCFFLQVQPVILSPSTCAAWLNHWTASATNLYNCIESISLRNLLRTILVAQGNKVVMSQGITPLALPQVPLPSLRQGSGLQALPSLSTFLSSPRPRRDSHSFPAMSKLRYVGVRTTYFFFVTSQLLCSFSPRV